LEKRSQREQAQDGAMKIVLLVAKTPGKDWRCCYCTMTHLKRRHCEQAQDGAVMIVLLVVKTQEKDRRCCYCRTIN
jgi:hypothetical protein